MAKEQIEFATQRKKNSLGGDSFIDAIAKKQNKQNLKQLKTRISEITSRFGKKIYAVTLAVF